MKHFLLPFWISIVTLIMRTVSFSTSCEATKMTYNVAYGSVGTMLLLKSTNYFVNSEPNNSTIYTIKYSVKLPSFNCSY